MGLKMVKKRSEAQKRAETNYNHKRLKQPSIPAIRLSEEEDTETNRIFEKAGGTKKAAVLEGLKLLEKNLDNS